MRYRLLGTSGLLVSELSFGAMTFGNSMGAIAKVDRAVAGRLVGQCIDAGVNLFDTSDVYSGGESEALLGESLIGHRDDVLVVTKVGFRRSNSAVNAGLSYAHVVRSAEASLRRMATDWIDLYLVHRPDPRTPLEETLRAFEDLRTRGLIRYAGVSNMSAWQQATCLGLQRQYGWAPLQANQLYYSLLNREIEHELVPACEYGQVGIMVWSPLASGYLTGRYSLGDRAASGGGGRRDGQVSFPPINLEAADAVVQCLRTIAQARGATLAQVALAWLLAKRHVATVVLGASTIRQLDDNLGAAELALDDGEVAELDELTAPAPIYPAWWAAHYADSFD